MRTEFPEFESLLLECDPALTKFRGVGRGNYTVWTPYGEAPLLSDGRRREIAAKIQVDRFTKRDRDEIASTLYDALDAAEFVSFAYQLDYESDTGYFHHIFDCEVL